MLYGGVVHLTLVKEYRALKRIIMLLVVTSLVTAMLAVRAGMYFAEPFDASEWRAQWVERMES
jgi:ActR/RegA family two-component response regulator